MLFWDWPLVGATAPLGYVLHGSSYMCADFYTSTPMWAKVIDLQQRHMSIWKNIYLIFGVWYSMRINVTIWFNCPTYSKCIHTHEPVWFRHQTDILHSCEGKLLISDARLLMKSTGNIKNSALYSIVRNTADALMLCNKSIKKHIWLQLQEESQNRVCIMCPINNRS